MFHALQAMFHFRYSSIELHHALVDKFLFFLHNGNIYVFESFQYEFMLEFLYQLHGIHDVCTCLSNMRLSTSTNQPENERGIWGGYAFPTMSSQQDKYIDQSLVTNKEEKVLVIQWKCKYIYALHLVPF